MGAAKFNCVRLKTGGDPSNFIQTYQDSCSGRTIEHKIRREHSCQIDQQWSGSSYYPEQQRQT
jgi:hypothetical protein